MHDTFEGIQRSATPVIRGPLKVYVVLLALLVTVTAQSTATHAVATVLFLGMSIDAVGVRPIRWFGVPLAFLLPGIAIILVGTPGEPVAAWWLLSISTAGVETATLTLTRSVASLSILSFLVLSTPVPAVVHSLRRLPLPPIIVELFLYVYRGIQVMVDEATRMHTAANARLGYRNWRTTYRSTKLMAATMLVKAFDRIERMSDSMRARNYDGKFPVAEGFESAGHWYAIVVLGLLLAVTLL